MISIQSSGNKTAGNGLLYSKAGVCVETPGPVACSDYFRYSFEGKAIVSDNAANWIVSQSIVSARSKGSYKSGATFDVTYPASPDGPGPGFVQTTTGNTVFWIDSPATEAISGNDPLSTLTSVNNFSVTVCSKVVSQLCYPYSWYTKLVVSAGGHLDPANSIEGQGYLSLTF